MLTEHDLRYLSECNLNGYLRTEDVEGMIETIRTLQQQNKQQQEFIEWAARIIGSGLDMGSNLRYDPMGWIHKYHSVKGGPFNE